MVIEKLSVPLLTCMCGGLWSKAYMYIIKPCITQIEPIAFLFCTIDYGTNITTIIDTNKFIFHTLTPATVRSSTCTWPSTQLLTIWATEFFCSSVGSVAICSNIAVRRLVENFTFSGPPN